MADQRKRQLEDSNPFGRQSSVIPESARGLTLTSLADMMQDDEPEVREVVRTEYVEVVPDGAIVPVEGGALQVGKFTLDMCGLVWGDDTTETDWQELGVKLFQIERASQWWAGDWLKIVIATWGENYDIEKVAQAFEIDAETLRDWQNVSENVPLPLRNGALSFSHHRAVAFLKTTDRRPDHDAMKTWLDKAAEKGWSVKQLRTEILRSKRGGKPTPPKLANRNNQDLIARVWKAVKGNKPVDRRDIQALRQWLLDVERRLATGNAEPEYSDDLD